MTDSSSPSGSSSLVGLVEKWRKIGDEVIKGNNREGYAYYRCADDLTAALATQTGRAGWQDISTAPKDGTTLLLKGDDWTRTAYWAVRIGTWVVDCVVPLSPPKFWMPLPPVPETKA